MVLDVPPTSVEQFISGSSFRRPRFVTCLPTMPATAEKQKGAEMLTDIKIHYIKISEALTFLRTSTGLNWEYETTGGSLDAYVLYRGDGFFLLTNEEACAPYLDGLRGEEELSLTWNAKNNDESDDLTNVFDFESLEIWAAQLGGE